MVLPRCINFQKDRSSHSENLPQQHRKSFQRLDKTLSKVDQLQKEQGFSFSEVNEALVKENKEKMKTQHGCIVLHKMIYKEPRSAISVEQYVK